jgi:hypothetical protein
MMWRQANPPYGSVVYSQQGDEPDKSDRFVGAFRNSEDAELAVEAVNMMERALIKAAEEDA